MTQIFMQNKLNLLSFLQNKLNLVEQTTTSVVEQTYRTNSILSNRTNYVFPFSAQSDFAEVIGKCDSRNSIYLMVGYVSKISFIFGMEGIPDQCKGIPIFCSLGPATQMSFFCQPASASYCDICTIGRKVFINIYLHANAFCVNKEKVERSVKTYHHHHQQLNHFISW